MLFELGVGKAGDDLVCGEPHQGMIRRSRVHVRQQALDAKGIALQWLVRSFHTTSSSRLPSHDVLDDTVHAAVACPFPLDQPLVLAACYVHAIAAFPTEFAGYGVHHLGAVQRPCLPVVHVSRRDLSFTLRPRFLVPPCHLTPWQPLGADQ